MNANVSTADDRVRDSYVQHTSENAPARSVPCERYISFPEHGGPNNSSADVRPLSNPSSPSRTATLPARCPSPSVMFESQPNGANDEQYILLEECFSGPASQKASTSPTFVVQPSLSHYVSPKFAAQPLSVDGNGHSVHSTVPVNHRVDQDGLSHSAEYFNLAGKLSTAN